MIFLVLPDVVTDEALLTALQEGSVDAVDRVYENYFKPLYQYTRLKVGDPALAEDIVSEVFVKLIRVVGTRAAPRKHLRGWLFQLTRNEIAQHYGKVNRVHLTQLEEWMPAPSEQNPEHQLSLTWDIERVRTAIRTLNNDHQEVLILRFGQRLSLQETADIMNRSVSAIKSLQFRALDNLRTMLKEAT